ncbi:MULTISPECIES: hypothetical protein [Bradyrhizobium]|uniref:Uncharacterized protein n=1 Tax=Bradyrhizobium yuanmingense TaxID=108015 RepID=A0ABV4GM86_9BRAD|nr:hypothetical protein [Bradyrhizobium yuanmingense]
MAIKPLAITYIKTPQKTGGFRLNYSMRATESLFPDAIGAGRTSAGMSIRLSICDGATALTRAPSFRWLGSRSIPLPHLR